MGSWGWIRATVSIPWVVAVWVPFLSASAVAVAASQFWQHACIANHLRLLHRRTKSIESQGRVGSLGCPTLIWHRSLRCRSPPTEPSQASPSLSFAWAGVRVSRVLVQRWVKRRRGWGRWRRRRVGVWESSEWEAPLWLYFIFVFLSFFLLFLVGICFIWNQINCSI